jgi:hypothetical protein
VSEANVRVIVKMPQGAPNADRCRDRLTGPEADRYGPGMELFSRTKKVTPPETVTPPEVPSLVSVDPSWAALPTLSHGKSEGQIKLSGPTFYRQNIAAALARYGPLVMAELRVVATGQYAGAVRVFVAGQQVASIPHSMSEEFGRVVLDLEADGQTATMHVELDMQDPYVDVWGYGIPERRHPVARPDEVLGCLAGRGRHRTTCRCSPLLGEAGGSRSAADDLACRAARRRAAAREGGLP